MKQTEKQNRKFIWMYGAILFSFALILIMFAGLSTKNEEKLSSSVSSLGRENSNLREEKNELYERIKDLEQQVEDVSFERDSFYNEMEAALLDCDGDVEVNEILLSGLREKRVGNDEVAKNAVSQLDLSKMTELQILIYNTIIE